jgi:hypothetical protein
MSEVKLTSDLVIVMDNGNRITAKEIKELLSEEVFSKFDTSSALAYYDDLGCGVIPWWWRWPKPIPPRDWLEIVSRVELLTSARLYGMSMSDVTALHKYGIIRKEQLSEFQQKEMKIF